MKNTLLQNYIQYSKRIVIFGIVQWAMIAIAALVLVLLSSRFDVYVDEWTAKVVNNIVTCSSALAVAICSGYYAHSAYDNSLKQKVSAAIIGDDTLDASDESGNG